MYVNETFKAIWDPQMVALEGEVTGFRVSQGQWVNFDLKDENALVPVFMVLAKLSTPLQDGMRVRLFGYPRVYPKYGKFSFQADRLELVGEGTLQRALAVLKQKLQTEGLFEPSRKRSLPRFPERIALIASRESAAYGDFVRILEERWRGLEIDLYHVQVQGERAPDQLVRAIQQANGLVREASVAYDALVVTRGGGSLEELMAFNDERVVRALFASQIPTLVGIGHERDITFAEEVADVRGSTPTDCARRLVPDRADVLYELATMQQTIEDVLRSHLDRWRQSMLAHLATVDHWQVEVSHRYVRAVNAALAGVDHWVTRISERMLSLERFLRSMDPQMVLRRGYAIVKTGAGELVTSVDAVPMRTPFCVELHDGMVDATAQSIKKHLL